MDGELLAPAATTLASAVHAVPSTRAVKKLPDEGLLEFAQPAAVTSSRIATMFERILQLTTDNSQLATHNSQLTTHERLRNGRAAARLSWPSSVKAVGVVRCELPVVSCQFGGRSSQCIGVAGALKGSVGAMAASSVQRVFAALMANDRRPVVPNVLGMALP